MARGINLGNKNMKNIFTDISRYPTRKHEIKDKVLFPAFWPFCGEFDIDLSVTFGYVHAFVHPSFHSFGFFQTRTFIFIDGFLNNCMIE